MNPNILSPALTIALNEQMAKEAHLSQVYLSYAVWADKQGFSGIANFLFGHSQHERDHMMQIVGYILKSGAKVQVMAIPAPPVDPVSINSCFESILDFDSDNAKALFAIEKICFSDNDWTTWNFIQWFVKDMVEAERIARSLLDQFRKADEALSAKILFSLN